MASAITPACGWSKTVSWLSFTCLCARVHWALQNILLVEVYFSCFRGCILSYLSDNGCLLKCTWVRWVIPVFMELRCRPSSRGDSCYITRSLSIHKTFSLWRRRCCLKTFIRFEDQWGEKRLYRGEYVREGSLDAPRKEIAQVVEAVYDGYLNNGNLEVTDF